MTPNQNHLDTRVLVLASIKRDSLLSADILKKAGIETQVCVDLNQLCDELGQGAGAVLVAGEMLTLKGMDRLKALLVKEPSWSHLPFLVVTSSGQISQGNRQAMSILDPLRNVTLLERPVRTATLISVIRAALADRRRQYETQQLLLKLERSNAELNQFASIASHDLQEPLRTVTNYVQLLDRRYGHTFDEAAKDYIGFAVDGTRRMRDLILALLTYAQVGASDAESVPLNTNHLLNEVTGILEVGIKEAEAAIEIQDRLPEIAGDETQLHQLFQNLLHNAIKFRRPGVAPKVVIKGESQNGRVLFSVSDNGIGINKDHTSQIFGIFKKLHSSRDYSGSGIGLAVCQKIVERHQGRIWVESELGKGTTFHFTLPSADDALGTGAVQEANQSLSS